MQMSHIRNTALCILLIAAQLLSSCQSAAETIETTQPETDTDTATTAPDELKSGVPDGVSFNGEVIRILNAPSQSPELLDADETNGDVLNDSVYKRNIDVMEKLDVTLEFITGSHNDILTTIPNSVQANDDAYDLITSCQYQLIKMLASGMFLNIMDAPYIDLDSPWWPETYIDNVNLGRDRRYFVTGDATLQYLRWISACYFNKQMYEDYIGDPNEMYELVYDGKWTFDKLNELTANIYQDLNGNGKTDEADILGYSVNTASGADSLFYDSGAVLTVIDSAGLPELAIYNELNINILTKFHELLYNNEAAWITNSGWDFLNSNLPQKFAQDQLMFMFAYFFTSDYLRDMKSEYGVIPYPKYDESIEDYRAIIHNDVSLFCLPVTCRKFDAVCAVLEEMAYQGYISTTPAYYDEVLKNKYVRGDADVASRMIDFIHDRTYTETVYVYASQLADAGYIQRSVANSSSVDIASLYAANESKYQAALDTLLEKYSALEN